MSAIEQPKTPPPAKPAVADVHPWRQAARQTAWVAAAFCLIVSLVLAVNLFRRQAVDPINNPTLVALKTQLVKSPNDEALKKQIRAYDLELRAQYLGAVELGRRCAWMLFGGVLVLLPSLHYVIWRQKLPRPGKYVMNPALAEIDAGKSRWAVAGVAGVLAVAGWYGVSQASTGLTLAAATPAKTDAKTAAAKPSDAAKPAPAPAANAPWPAPEEFAKNWPRFRGNGGLGVSAHKDVPLTWDAPAGTGVLWKAKIPISSHSSPLVWGNRVFLTGATPKNHEVYCYDADTGNLLWQKSVGAAVKEAPKEDGGESSSAGANTGVTDGQRVYVTFENGDVAAFDYAGNQVWLKSLGRPDNGYGHATSLDIHDKKVLVQIDQGDGEEGNGKSAVYALDTATGNVVWQTSPRPVPGSWASPIIVKAGDKEQLIASGNPWLMGYSLTDGAELWRAKVCGGEVTPSPVFAQGLVISCNEKLCAVKPDGSGDVTATHVAWKAEDGIPDICSPMTDGERVYLLTSSGLFTCYDAKTGKKLYEKETDQDYKASPSLVGDKILLVSEKGVAVVAQAGPEYKEIGRYNVGEPVVACPAFAPGRLFIRGKDTLFCIGAKAGGQ